MKKTINEFPGLYREVVGDGIIRFRILINFQNKKIQEYFYVGPRRSEEDSRKAAEKRWHAIRMFAPVLTGKSNRERLRKPTASGVAGVTRITTKTRGYKYEVWKASWTNLDGSRGSKQFSVNRYGELEAKRLALQARQEHLDQIPT